ncbi:MAG: alpha/beta hydrolase-fold protein [Candidatus Izemoplasma sp.]
MKNYILKIIKSASLNRDVKVFIYLPKDYADSKEQYPVLYMHDGHNLFDDKTATYGTSWGIVESFKNIDNLPKVIIVGVETTGPSRMKDLSPYEFTYKDKTVGGGTDKYYDFMINILKPMIDLEYRTLSDPFNTAVMGSSLGGISSLYAALKYSTTFTRFGCISNAFMVSYEAFKHAIYEADLSSVNKMYLDVGTKEAVERGQSESYLESNKGIYIALKGKLTKEKLRFDIIPEANHNESAWAKRFPEILKYIFS